MRTFLFLFVLLAVFSCQHQRLDQSSKSSSILIENFEGKVLNTKNVVAKTRVLKLHTDSMGYIGQIKDVCAIDSFIYVLDGVSHSISKFKWSDGILVNSICSRGSGPLEYIQPIALSADAEYLYLLDLSGMSILVYDKDLKAIKKMRLTFPCMDFMKVSDGFLCYNPSPTTTLGQIVYIDLKGEILNHFLSEDKMMSVAPNAKVFTKNVDGNIFITPFFSYTTYLWNSEKELEPFVSVDFASQNIPNDLEMSNTNLYEENYAIPANFFKISTGYAYSFLCKGVRYYSFAHTDEIINGSISHDSDFPFFPQWQIEDYLIGTCALEELSDADYKDEEVGEVLLVFTLK